MEDVKLNGQIAAICDFLVSDGFCSLTTWVHHKHCAIEAVEDSGFGEICTTCILPEDYDTREYNILLCDALCIINDEERLELLRKKTMIGDKNDNQ